MILEWVKSRKEISKEDLEKANGKAKIRKGKSHHAKAKAMNNNTKNMNIKDVEE